MEISGALVFVYEREEGKHHGAVTLAPGKWAMVFAASVVDGSPVALDEIA